MTESQKKNGVIAGAILGAILLLGQQDQVKSPDNPACPDGKCPVPKKPDRPLKPIKPAPGPYTPPPPDDPFSPNQPKP